MKSRKKRKKIYKKKKFANTTAPDLNVIRTRKGPIHFPSLQNVTVFFDSISARVRNLIEEVPYIQVCVCWITNNMLLNALKKKDGVSLIISRGAMANKKKAFYKTLTPITKERGAVRVLGAEGRNNSLCHHKFAIGLDKDKKAVFLISGSFNWSVQGQKNIENLMVFRDKTFIAAWQSEFNLLWNKSTKYV